jgi:hypothetical protein
MRNHHALKIGMKLIIYQPAVKVLWDRQNPI